MTLVVFLRGVNVGGHKTFKPSTRVEAPAEYDLVNIGAAGTSVARRATDPKNLRLGILRNLPFEAALMIRPAAEILSLVHRDPFRPLEADVKPFVGILAGTPRPRPRLPIKRPQGRGWEVRVVRVAGCYALSLLRKRPS